MESGNEARCPPTLSSQHLLRSFLLSSDSLTKKVQERPKYEILVEHPFIKMTEQLEVDVGAWYRDILDREAALS